MTTEQHWDAVSTRSGITYNDQTHSFVLDSIFGSVELRAGQQDWSKYSDDLLREIYNMLYIIRDNATPGTPKFELSCDLYSDLRQYRLTVHEFLV